MCLMVISHFFLDSSPLDDEDTTTNQQLDQGQGGSQGHLSAVDIIIPCFTITAPSKPLFVNSSLRIVQGRKYGLLGPNGRYLIEGYF